MAAHLASGWKSFEVVQRNGVAVISDALASQPQALALVHNKIRIVQDLGWPEAKRLFNVVKKDDLIWLLKCKPSCWRLYFYVYEQGEQKGLVYVHAQCKKRDKEDPEDARKARRVVESIRPGGSSIAPFPFEG